LIGLAIGLGVAIAMARVLSRFLPLVDSADWILFASVSAELAALALTACYLPARRATRVPVMSALRYE
jgi:ABC-type antimicrobial peptide transport system permease subunit